MSNKTADYADKNGFTRNFNWYYPRHPPKSAQSEVEKEYTFNMEIEIEFII